MFKKVVNLGKFLTLYPEFTVKGCIGEPVQLELDIDGRRPEQPCHPWTWVPATGNLMYMMPQVGTCVSLYFKGDEEDSAVAVNCIRSGTGCEGADYRDKSLTTEHGMQLRLCQCDMGVVTLKKRCCWMTWRESGWKGTEGWDIRKSM